MFYFTQRRWCRRIVWTKRGNKTPIISITAAQYNWFYFKYYINSISSVLKYRTSDTNFEGRRCIKKHKEEKYNHRITVFTKTAEISLKEAEAQRRAVVQTSLKAQWAHWELQYNNHSTGLSIIWSVMYYSEILKQKPKVYMSDSWKKSIQGFFNTFSLL